MLSDEALNALYALSQSQGPGSLLHSDVRSLIAQAREANALRAEVDRLRRAIGRAGLGIERDGDTLWLTATAVCDKPAITTTVRTGADD